jgi:hypothetical protein
VYITTVRKKTLLSKDMLVAAVAGVGTIATFAFGAPMTVSGVLTAAGAPVVIGGLLSARNKFLSTRIATLQRHPMSYLYELKAGRKKLLP